jgi:hypothetical protein
MGKKGMSGSKRGAGLAKWQKKQPKKARPAETAEPPQQILVQPAPTTTTVQPTPINSAAQSVLKQKQRGGRKSRAFNCDGAEMQTPLPKKRARSKSQGGEARSTTRHPTQDPRPGEAPDWLKLSLAIFTAMQPSFAFEVTVPAPGGSP